MTIETHKIDDRAAWLAMRGKDVTGSEVGALFGVHRYLTPAQLYAEKSGAVLVEEDGGGPTSVMRRGLRLESFVAGQIQIMQPNWSVVKGECYWRDGHHRIGGTPDYIVADCSNGQPAKSGILEIKTVGMRDFIDIWRGCDKDGEIIPEPWQILQVQTYLHLTGASFGKIAVMPVSDWAPLDIHVIDIPRNDEIIERIISKVNQFWSFVDRGGVPEFDYSKDLAAIKAIYANASPGKIVDLRGDEEMAELLCRRDDIKKQLKMLDDDLAPIEAEIRARIGDAESVLVDGFDAVTLKNIHRKEYTVAATDYRQLRVKRSKQP